MTTIRGSNPVATSCFPTPSATPLPQVQGPSERDQFRNAVSTLKANFDKVNGGGWFDDTIDANELYKASRSSDPAVAEAARFLLAHPEMMGELDTGKHNDGNYDGKISMGDIENKLSSLDRETAIKALRTDPRGAEFAQSMGVLEQNWDKLDTAGFFNFIKDGKVSVDDLNRISGDASASPELRRAALFLATNPDLWALIDVAAKGGDKDGVVSREDLAAFAQQVTNVSRDMQQQYIQPRYIAG